MSAPLLQAAAALAVVGALLAARRIALRRGAGPAAIEVRARCALGREIGVAVVRVHGRELVLGYGASGVSLLLQRDASAEEGLS